MSLHIEIRSCDCEKGPLAMASDDVAKTLLSEHCYGILRGQDKGQ